MRKISIVFLAAAMVMSAACVKEQPALNDGKFSLSVSISSEAPAPLEVKTHLAATVENNQRKVYWSNGDAIAVNGVASSVLSGLADNAASATFTFASAPGAVPYKLVYPAGIYTDATHVTLPATQTYASGTFADGMFPMAGYSADGSNLSVHHLCAVLKVNILRKVGEGADEHDLVSASFRGLAGEQVSGSFILDYKNATLTGASSADADKQVKVTKVLSTSTSTVATYYLVVPAGTYAGGIAIDIQDKGGDLMTISKAASVTLEAGKLYDMQEVAYERTGDAPADIIITTAQELIDFATDYNAGNISGDNLVVALGNDITFDATTSADFVATGGIGAGGSSDPLFNGLFNGAGYSIKNLSSSVPVFARVGANGSVKNLKIASSCTFTQSETVSANLYLAAVAGYCKGNITDCENAAAVTCSSSAHSTNILYIGGVVARQNTSGTISGCQNSGTVLCTNASGSGNIYMGGIAGAVERPESGNSANIQNCTNLGLVKNGLDSSEPAQACVLHMGGVVGWINSTASSSKMTVSGLVNMGNVTKTNAAKETVGNTVLVAGIVGGVHGATVSTASGVVVFKNCRVSGCTLSNGAFNNLSGYGQAPHTGGFIGIARGENANDITFSDNCFVRNVDVKTRRGFGAGFASFVQGATLNGCNVLSSSLQGSLGQLRWGGGLVGYLRGNCTLQNCIVTLTKDATHSLWGRADGNTGNNVIVGGLVGNMSSSTNTITGCKAYVDLMYVEKADPDTHGWLIGSAGGDLTVTDCGWGGTFGSGTASLELNNSNYSTYMCGSGAPATESGSFYWDGSDAPAGSTVETITISDYDSEWTNNTEHPVITKGNVTLTASGNEGTQNGVFYTGTPSRWHFYQARGGRLTISVPAGHTLVSATFTYSKKNTGDVLLAPDGTTQISSGSSYPLSGSSATFSVGNNDNLTNGQVRFEVISVEYE